MIFERFVKTGSIITLARQLVAEGVVNRRGNAMDKSYLHKLLRNQVYIGKAVHKGVAYDGQHEAIIDPVLWDRVHAILGTSARQRAANTRAQTPALLKGLLYGPTGHAMSPTHTRRKGKLYRYYLSQAVLKHGAGSCPVGRIAAAEVEGAVIAQVRTLLRAPEVVVATWKQARTEGISEEEVREALARLDPLWEELFPAEQARVIQLLVERVDLDEAGASIRLRVEGLGSVASDLSAIGTSGRAAA
jgi:hypothetical protein